MTPAIQGASDLLPSNLHPLDRALRLVLGIVMFVVGWIADEGALALALRVFAFYPLATALLSWCPIYALLSFRTRR